MTYTDVGPLNYYASDAWDAYALDLGLVTDPPTTELCSNLGSGTWCYAGASFEKTVSHGPNGIMVNYLSDNPFYFCAGANHQCAHFAWIGWTGGMIEQIRIMLSHCNTRTYDDMEDPGGDIGTTPIGPGDYSIFDYIISKPLPPTKPPFPGTKAPELQEWTPRLEARAQKDLNKQTEEFYTMATLGGSNKNL